MKIVVGEHEFEMGSPEMGELRDSSGLVDQPAALGQRLREEGYLLLRGFHDRERIMRARGVVCAELAAKGLLREGSDPLEAVAADRPRGVMWGGRKGVTHHPDMRAVLESEKLMAWFSRLFGEAALTFDYKWLRAVAPREFTGAHYDVVYMGRGSGRLLTCWTPLGDLPFDQGPLLLCADSHRGEGFSKVRETYGKMDVDRDHVQGSFSMDAREVLAKFGGRWLTAEFQAGDLVIFGMYLMHMSASNTSGHHRISADCRFQPAGDPVDERWVGENPIAHYGWDAGEKNVAMEAARAKWGV